MAAALKRHREEGEKTDGTKRLGVGEIASLYGVPQSSLGHRIKGRGSRGAWGRARKWMTEAEEVEMVGHIKIAARRAVGLKPQEIQERANAILQARKGPDFKVGLNWVLRFLAAHPEWGLYRGTKLDKARRNGLNPTAVWNFEEAVAEVYSEENPEPGQIFGMDESGLMLGTGPPQVVVGESGQRHQHQAEDGDRELVSAIVTICADGTKLKEVIVFRGKYVYERWGDDNPGDLRCVVRIRIALDIALNMDSQIHRLREGLHQ